MVNEEYLAKMCKFTKRCCFIHALEKVDPSDKDFDKNHLSTLLTLKSILSRISATARDFICLCM